MTLFAKTDLPTLVDRMFDELPFFPDLAPRFGGATALPAMDVYEKDGKYVIELAVPGYDAKDINAEVNAGTITISGTHTENAEKKTAKFYRKEMSKGSFKRTVTLPQEIDPTKVEAKVTHGVLTLNLAPIVPIAAKKIEIKGA